MSSPFPHPDDENELSAEELHDKLRAILDAAQQHPAPAPKPNPKNWVDNYRVTDEHGPFQRLNSLLSEAAEITDDEGPWLQGLKADPLDPQAHLHSLLVTPEDAYDERGWFERHKEQQPVPTPKDVQWFHATPADLPVGTVLAPHRGAPPWLDHPYHGGLDNRANWTWVEYDLTHSDDWISYMIRDHGVCFLYRVQPRLGPFPWNGSGKEGWVTDAAVIVEVLGHYEGTEGHVQRVSALGEEPPPSSQILYHLTDTADFTPRPRYRPQNNEVLYGGKLNSPGLFLTKDPLHWAQDVGYRRPYVAEFEAPADLHQREGVVTTPGYDELLVPPQHYPSLALKRMLPIDALEREQTGHYGEAEQDSGRDFDTGEHLPYRMVGDHTPPFPEGYRYDQDPRSWAKEYQDQYRRQIHRFRKKMDREGHVRKVGERYLQSADVVPPPVQPPSSDPAAGGLPQIPMSHGGGPDSGPAYIPPQWETTPPGPYQKPFGVDPDTGSADPNQTKEPDNWTQPGLTPGPTGGGIHALSSRQGITRSQGTISASDPEWGRHQAAAQPPEGLRIVHERPTSSEVKAYLGDQWVGGLSWYPPGMWRGDYRDPPEGARPYQVMQLDVHPDYRHQGIATAMFNHVKQHIEPRLEHSDRLTDAGAGFVRSMGHEPPEDYKRLPPYEASRVVQADPEWGRDAPLHTARIDYGGHHESPGPGTGFPIHDMHSGSGEYSLGGVPEDWQTHPEYYASPHESPGWRGMKETQRVYNRVNGNPEAEVGIYRALPPGHTTFNTGDWVTPSLAYAQQHAASESYGDGADWPVIRTTVPAKHLWQNGDSYYEMGYHGPAHEGEVVGQRTSAQQKTAAPLVTVFSKPGCPQCVATHRHLDKKGVPFNAVDLTQDPAALEHVQNLGYSSAPVVQVGLDEGNHWSGYRPDRLDGLSGLSREAAVGPEQPDLWLHPKEVLGYGSPDNTYHDFEGIKSDITQNGVLRPVRINTDGKTAWLEDGHHRARAAHELGIKEIPAHVTSDLGSEEDAPVGPGLKAWLASGGTPREPGWDMDG